MRTKNAINNIFFGLILQIVTTIIGLILPRMFIEHYGSTVNGMVSSITHFVSYLYLVEGGIGAAAIAALYSPLATDNKHSVNRILASANEFYIKSGKIFLLLILMMAMFYPLLVGDEISYALTALMVLILGAGSIFEFFLIGKYRVLLTADQKMSILTIVQIVTLIIGSIIKIILINKGYNILLVQSISIIVLFFRYLIIYAYITKKYSYLNLNVEPDLLATNKKWDALMHKISGLITYTSPVILITIFCDLSDVSIYAIYSMVFSSIMMIINSIDSGLTASFGNVFFDKKGSSLRKIFGQYELLYGAIFTWVYACTFLLILPFIEIYINDVADIDYVRENLALLFVVAGIANNIKVPQNTLINAAGHFKETRNSAIIEAILSITLTAIFVYYWGLNGALIGNIIAYGYRSIYTINYSSKYLIINSLRTTTKRYLINALLFLVSISLGFFTEITATSFFSWILNALLISIWVGFIVLAGYFIFEQKEMRNIFIRIKGLI